MERCAYLVTCASPPSASIRTPSRRFPFPCFPESPSPVLGAITVNDWTGEVTGHDSARSGRLQETKITGVSCILGAVRNTNTWYIALSNYETSDEFIALPPVTQDLEDQGASDGRSICGKLAGCLLSRLCHLSSSALGECFLVTEELVTSLSSLFTNTYCSPLSTL